MDNSNLIVTQPSLVILSASQKCVLTPSETKPIVNLYMKSASRGLGKEQSELDICAG